MSDRAMITYWAGDAIVRVEVEPPALGTALRGLFPTVEEHDGTADFRVRSRGTGFVLESALNASVHENATELTIALEFSVADALLDRSPDLVRLHASGALVGGTARLVLGRAEAGKSSIAYAWHCAGHSVYGDDLVLLDAEGRARAFPRLFKLDPRQFTDAGARLEDTPFWAPGYDAAWYDPAAGPGWAAPAPVSAVVVSRFRAGVGVGITPLDRKAGLNALLHSVIPGGVAAQAAFSTLAAVAERAHFAEIVFGDARAAAVAVAAWTG